MRETPLLCEKQLSIPRANFGLVVQGVEDMEIREKEHVIPCSIFLAQGAAIRVSGQPDPGNLRISSNREIPLAHGVRDRMMRGSLCRTSVLTDLQR